MTSYLSIDLDYWMLHLNDTACVKFFNRIFSLGLPIQIVQSHEELLPHINENKADVLYNVDYHSDLFGFNNEEEPKTWLKENNPKDGTWGAYVDWRKDGHFVWIHPQSHCMEIGKGACWHNPKENPFRGAFVEWNKVSNSLGKGRLNLDSVIAVGVAVSPEFTEIATVWRVAILLGLIEDNYLGESDSTFFVSQFNRRWDPFIFDPQNIDKRWYRKISGYYNSEILEYHEVSNCKRN